MKSFMLIFLLLMIEFNGIAESGKTKKWSKELNVNQFRNFGGKKTKWKGFDRYDFDFNGRLARVVCPSKPKPGNPWIWNARFPDWHTEIDSILLSEGFYVTYLNTDELCGSPEAVKVWTDYYNFLTTKYLFNRKVALEAVSRGGLYVYNWAKEYPERVSCIYAEAPVCDFKSWPGGFGSGPGSPEDWELIKNAYGFKNDSIAKAYTNNPVDNLEKLAAANVPLLHMISLEDKIVPASENTEILINRYLKLGGPAKVVICSKYPQDLQGHHFPIETPRLVADFVILNALYSDIKINPQAFHTNRSNFENSRIVFEREKKGRVAFLGGSITQGGGWRDSICKYLQAKFPQTKFEFINAGIASTGSVPGAFRLENDVLSKGKIDLLFEEAAVNDETNGMSPTQMIRGMEGIIRHARQSNPEMDILIMFMADPDKMKVYNEGQIPLVIQQHDKVAEFYGVSIVNFAKEITCRINQHEFSWEKDFIDLHPSAFGQGIYANSLITFFEKAWKDKLLEKSKSIARINPEKCLDDFSYFNGRFISIKNAKLIKGWKINPKWNLKDQIEKRDGFVNVPVLESNKPGEELQLKFIGKAIGLFVIAGPDAGMLEYSIDGSNFQKLDIFTKWSSFVHLPWLYILHDELAVGEHLLKLRISNDKNPNSKGTACRIVQFVVNE